MKVLTIKFIVAFAIAITMMSLLNTAFADTGEFTFVPPTEREDSSPLLPSEISGYTVDLNGIPVDTINPLPSTATGFTLDLPIGDNVIRILTVDTDGRQSLWATLPVRIMSNPKPPSGLIVRITR